MRLDIECVFLLIWALLVQDSSEEGYCSFPDFLWAAMPDGSDRKWLSKTEYVRNTVTLTQQREITVHRTEMIIKHRSFSTCDEQYSHPGMPCIAKDILYHVVCLAEEPGDNKFRVMHSGNDIRKPLFSCIKFIKINENIVLIYSATPKSINEDRLCYEESLVREEWPWFVTEQLAWSKCPFEGGYDFIQYYRNQKICRDVWRPSRLEMECIYGEGVDFFFPDPTCNTFSDTDRKLEFKLYCWGSWDEGDFKFVLMSQENKQPQYIMRFPQAVDLYAEFTAYLYFSPVSTVSGQGEPPVDVYYTELRMKRSEPGVCFDESEKCREFAQEGKCTNSALHEYANFCRRSCGLCDYIPSPRPECRFPLDYRGEWMLFERERKESVTIASGEVTFSNLGHFICKTKHWAINRYKLMSVFTNGCRPRYTCIHFSEESDVVLQYQISSSKHIDESFKMCSFKDDPKPLGNKIRSKDMKVLLPTSHIHWGSCGLSGEIRVNATFAEGYSCQGVLTDWSQRSCNSRSKLILALDVCKSKHSREDHICIAHMNVDDDYSLLITQQEGFDKEFRCWAIQTYPESMYYRPWRKAMLMRGAQCGTEMDLMPGSSRRSELIIQAFSEKVQQPCRESNDRVLDYYDTETTVHTHMPTTSQKTLVFVNTAVGLHEKESIKPRERKSNTASFSLPNLLTALTAALTVFSNYR